MSFLGGSVPLALGLCLCLYTDIKSHHVMRLSTPHVHTQKCQIKQNGHGGYNNTCLSANSCQVSACHM